MTIRSIAGRLDGFGKSRFSIAASNPLLFEGDFESIATTTVGSGGAAFVEFTGIPATYKTLQIRAVTRGTFNGTQIYAYMRLNGATTNYAYHGIRADGGGTVGTETGTGSDKQVLGLVPGATATSSTFGYHLIDIVDYASTSKTKVVRSFGGHDRNGAGQVSTMGNFWNSTAAVTSVRIYPNSGSWAQFTSAALYGIKG